MVHRSLKRESRVVLMQLRIVFTVTTIIFVLVFTVIVTILELVLGESTHNMHVATASNGIASRIPAGSLRASILTGTQKAQGVKLKGGKAQGTKLKGK